MAVDKPKLNRSLEDARKIIADLDPSHDVPGFMREKFAKALVDAFDDGVLYQHEAIFADRRELLAKLLREYGIGIATLDEIKSRTTAIAKGEIEPDQNEPKLWFSSIETLVNKLKSLYPRTQPTERSAGKKGRLNGWLLG